MTVKEAVDNPGPEMNRGPWKGAGPSPISKFKGLKFTATGGGALLSSPCPRSEAVQEPWRTPAWVRPWIRSRTLVCCLLASIPPPASQGTALAQQTLKDPVGDTNNPQKENDYSSGG